MSVTVYKHSDGSAPQIQRTAGAMITFFDSVLVSGYGSQSSAGWTKITASGNAAAYRAPTALQSIYMIVDDANDVYTKVRFSSEFGNLADMAGVAWPPPSYGSGLNGLPEWNALYKSTSSLAATTTVRWSLVNSTTRGFHFWVDSNNETAATVLTYGGFYSIVKPKMYDNNDSSILTAFKIAVAGHYYDTVLENNFVTFANYYSNPARILYRTKGLPWAVCKVGYFVFGSGQAISYFGSTTNYNPTPDTIRGDMIVQDINIASKGESATILGRIPGLLNPYSRLAVTQGQTVSGSAPFAGINFEAYTGGTGRVLVNITDW